MQNKEILVENEEILILNQDDLLYDRKSFCEIGKPCSLFPFHHLDWVPFDITEIIKKIIISLTFYFCLVKVNASKNKNKIKKGG